MVDQAADLEPIVGPGNDRIVLRNCVEAETVAARKKPAQPGAERVPQDILDLGSKDDSHRSEGSHP